MAASTTSVRPTMQTILISVSVILISASATAHAQRDPEVVPHFISVVVTSGMGGWLDGVRESHPHALERGGAARLSSLLRFMRRRGDVVYIDTGSLIGENGGQRRPDRATRVLAALGCAAVAIGDEDGATAGSNAESPVPLISADASRPAVDGFRVARSTITNIHGTPIAIIGGPSLGEVVPPSALRTMARAIVEEAGRARKNAELVIVAVHAAGVCNELQRINDFSPYKPEHCDPTSPLLALTHEMAVISKALPASSIDLVVGGHATSRGVTAVVDGIPVVAPTGDALTFSEIGLKRPADRAVRSNLPLDYMVVPPHSICGRIIPGDGPCGTRSFDPSPLKSDPEILKLLNETR